MKLFNFIFPCFLIAFSACTSNNQKPKIQSEKRIVPIFSEPVLTASSNGIPVYTYGYTDILGESPDLLDAVNMQIGNNNPFPGILNWS